MDCCVSHVRSERIKKKKLSKQCKRKKFAENIKNAFLTSDFSSLIIYFLFLI